MLPKTNSLHPLLLLMDQVCCYSRLISPTVHPLGLRLSAPLAQSLLSSPSLPPLLSSGVSFLPPASLLHSPSSHLDISSSPSVQSSSQLSFSSPSSRFPSSTLSLPRSVSSCCCCLCYIAAVARCLFSALLPAITTVNGHSLQLCQFGLQLPANLTKTLRFDSCRLDPRSSCSAPNILPTFQPLLPVLASTLLVRPRQQQRQQPYSCPRACFDSRNYDPNLSIITRTLALCGSSRGFVTN
jgi:hypothetical protein